jgi:hypothetical protein
MRAMSNQSGSEAGSEIGATSIRGPLWEGGLIAEAGGTAAITGPLWEGGLIAEADDGTAKAGALWDGGRIASGNSFPDGG